MLFLFFFWGVFFFLTVRGSYDIWYVRTGAPVGTCGNAVFALKNDGRWDSSSSFTAKFPPWREEQTWNEHTSLLKVFFEHRKILVDAPEIRPVFEKMLIDMQKKQENWCFFLCNTINIFLEKITKLIIFWAGPRVEGEGVPVRNSTLSQHAARLKKWWFFHKNVYCIA